jgi:GNAT superfamily N-acetyltransferase
MRPNRTQGLGRLTSGESAVAAVPRLDIGHRTPGVATKAIVETGPLRPQDRAAWEVLARAYKRFNRQLVPESGYEATWRRLLDDTDMHGVCARLNGRLVGIAHYLFHRMVWTSNACYLQDLFVDEAERGQGAARALIEHIAGAARDQGAFRLYWITKDDNVQARLLYDRIGDFSGFIRYDYPIL